MKKKAKPGTPKADKPLIERIRQLLRRHELMDYWTVGELLRQRVDSLHAELLRIAAALNDPGGKMGCSENHLYKCCQFRRLWKPNEVKAAVGVPWRRVLQLTYIKALAERLTKPKPGEEVDMARYDAIGRQCAKFIRDFPRTSVKDVPAWAKKVENFKAECRENNPGFRPMNQRLMLDCWKSAVFRLDGAAEQIEKMRQFLPAEKHEHARAALECVKQARKPLNRIYTKKEMKAPQVTPGVKSPTRSSASR